MAIRVVVADDQEIVRTGLTMILNAQPDIDVVGEAADGNRSRSPCGHTRPAGSGRGRSGSVMAMSGELSFFELGVDDAARARRFYGSLFGWEFTDQGSGATIETQNIPGGLHGDDPGASPLVFFRVDDLDDALTRVRALGGALSNDLGSDDPDTIARFGRFALCVDDQGSSFGLHQPPR